MIDFHTHPLLVREMIARYPELERAAREVFYIGNRFQPLEVFLLELDVAGLERAVVLPIEATRTRGLALYTNQQIAELCALPDAKDRLIGFASVDPVAKDAPDELSRAVEKLGLRGLKLSPPAQEFMPDDPAVFPVYERAVELNIPVIIHSGLSWEPRARLAYGHPLRLETPLAEYPELHLVIAHMAWPWTLDAVALALKYPNAYLDTSALYFDNPLDFTRFVFNHQLPLTVFENSLRNQLVFGSNYPRVEIKNMARAMRQVGLSEGAQKLLFETNARRLLGELS